MDPFFEKLNFPYENVREGQAEFIRRVYSAIQDQKPILVSAPTGSGKTVSALAPALALAKERKKTVICLTSRQTQANQVIKTIKDINIKAQNKIKYVAFIGKRSMCVHQERDLYPASDFLDFCKKVREQGKCKFFKNARDEEKAEEIKQVLNTTSDRFMSVEEFVDFTGSCSFCPYEMAAIKAYQTDVVVADYNYLFAQGMQQAFLGKVGRELEDCIVIVDEAHNLPDRVRSSYSYTLSTELLNIALKELQDYFKESKYDSYVQILKDVLEQLYFDKKMTGKQQFMITKDDFLAMFLSRLKGKTLDDVIDQLQEAEALIKEDKIVSQVGRVAQFLDRWFDLDDESFLRLLEKEERNRKDVISLNIKCIDPSSLCQEVFEKAYSTVLMSATLSPLEMYRDVLGLPRTTQMLELDSPFDKKNQLTLVVDDVTSKYTSRSPQMFKAIADYLKEILVAGHGKNAIVFFPSYSLMDQITSHMRLTMLDRRVLKEQRAMTKDQKEKIVEEFKNAGYTGQARVLFAVTSGSFAEGLDLPRDALEMVVVVGLPLAVPDVVTQSVIGHFDKKFRKGELYGYVYPAMNKIIQAAGRCIRTEDDKGVVVLMDNRFLWPKYALSFPKHWKLKTVNHIGKEIEDFF